MTSSISIGELQKKTSYFRSKEPFFIRDNRKKKNISVVFPYDEENSELLVEIEKLYEKYHHKNSAPRVFSSTLSVTEGDIERFWESDHDISQEFEDSVLFPK